MLLFFISSLCLFACDRNMNGGSELEEAIKAYVLPEKPDYGEPVSVHDPSVMQAHDGLYYAFGSHFAVSKSGDLIKWEQVSRDGGHRNLYNDWRATLKDALAYVPGGTSTWAPAVVFLQGKYYMYYSLSTFGSQKSYIGRVEASSPLGSYENSVEILRSGDINGPNAIDPEVFFDQDGRLWMVYGSFFAGIYIIELHNKGKKIGLPKQQGFGKRLWAGNMQNGPEGPYIFYNPKTEYYYLMTSHGSLANNYNMRVARSKNPDGPYHDPFGNDVSEYQAGGAKLAGNYQFAGQRGQAALGHNSVIQVGNQYFVVHHLRFREGESRVSGYHNQQTRQLFFNEDGWPVLSPNRYAGEKLGSFAREDLLGEYDLIFHTNENAVSFSESVACELKADGEIHMQGEPLGTWELVGDYYINLVFGEDVFKGVAVPQWIEHLDRAGIAITAIAQDKNERASGIWAVKPI